MSLNIPTYSVPTTSDMFMSYMDDDEDGSTKFDFICNNANLLYLKKIFQLNVSTMTCVQFFEFKGTMLKFSIHMTIEECWFVAKNTGTQDFDQLCALAKIWSNSKNNGCIYDLHHIEQVAVLAKNMYDTLG